MTLWAYSIFGVETRKGLVKLVRDKEVIATVSPAEARDWALNILQAAEAAETDEFMWAFFTGTIGIDENKAAQVLVDFRKYREKKQDEKAGD
jgi:hypothetical protein